MLDRRQNARRKTFLGARAVFNHRQSTSDCIVRNLGDRGAKIVFADTTFLPDEFDVQITRLTRSVRARVAWRSPVELGILFLDPARSGVVPIEHAIRARQLRAENEALTRRVAELSGAE